MTNNAEEAKLPQQDDTQHQYFEATLKDISSLNTFEAYQRKRMTPKSPTIKQGYTIKLTRPNEEDSSTH